MSHPSRELIIELIDVDLETGILRWRHTAGTKVAGAIVGSLNKDGYRRTTIRGCHAMVHVIVWFLATGDWLPGKIDHHDRNRDHNAFSNLRKADGSQQRANTGLSRRNRSGVKGVLDLGRGPRPFWARLMVRGARLSLGYFATLDEARAAYRVAAIKHFGEFSSEAAAA